MLNFMELDVELLFEAYEVAKNMFNTFSGAYGHSIWKTYSFLVENLMELKLMNQRMLFSMLID